MNTFYTSFTFGETEQHYSIRAADMAGALQRLSDFCAGVNTARTKPSTPIVRSMSLTKSRGIEYVEGF